MAAALATLGAAALGAGASVYSANKQAKNTQDAAGQSYDLYRQSVNEGLEKSKVYYDEAQGYLDPYRQAGEYSTQLLLDILGQNGPEAQARAKAMYESSPSAQLNQAVLDDATRRTLGSYAAGGLSNSGSATESLARRLSGLTLDDYHKWQGLAQGMSGQGLQAAGLSSQLAGNYGGQTLNALSGIGSAGAASTMWGANAENAAWQSGTNSFNNLLGMASKYNWNKSQPNTAGAWQTTTTTADGRIL
jgi:hypothetical protein